MSDQIDFLVKFQHICENRMPEKMSGRLSEYVRNKMPQCQNICQIECQIESRNLCQRGRMSNKFQNRCHVECLAKCRNKCPNRCLDMPWWGPFEVKHFPSPCWAHVIPREMHCPFLARFVQPASPIGHWLSLINRAALHVMLVSMRRAHVALSPGVTGDWCKGSLFLFPKGMECNAFCTAANWFDFVNSFSCWTTVILPQV